MKKIGVRMMVAELQMQRKRELIAPFFYTSGLIYFVLTM